MILVAPRVILLGLVPIVAVAIVACGGDDGGSRRTVQIVQTDASCTPATIDATLGEKLRLEVRNDGKRDAEVEGIEGTKVEETFIPSGKTRSTDYTAPSKAATNKVKCYVPTGQSTIIQINVK